MNFKISFLIILFFFSETSKAMDMTVIKAKGSQAMVDVSEPGTFQKGDRITVTLGDGRRVEAEVRKIKGYKALLKFIDSTEVRSGEVLGYSSADGSTTGTGSGAQMSGNFKYGVTGGFDMESMTYSSNGTDFDIGRMGLDARFGFVKPQYEFGPILMYFSQSFDFGFGSQDIATLFFGGYGEYNFKISNDQLIPSAGGIIGYASSELTGDVSGFRIEPYVRVKYFLQPGSGVAVLGQLGYRLEELSGNNVDVSGSGFVMNAALGYYF